MTAKTFIWKGPATTVELYGDDTGVPVFSGPVAPGSAIPVALDPDHPQIKSWMAFRLMEVAADSPAEPSDTAAPTKRRKESDNG